MDIPPWSKDRGSSVPVFPRSQHTTHGHTLLGTPQGHCHPLAPLAGFNPRFIPFQRLTKGISGVPGSGALFSQSPAEGWECLGAK